MIMFLLSVKQVSTVTRFRVRFSAGERNILFSKSSIPAVGPIQALGAIFLCLQLPEVRPWSAEQLFLTLHIYMERTGTQPLHYALYCIVFANWQRVTFLLLPTWYTNFLFIHTNYIKLNSSTCFELNPFIIRRSTMKIVHMQPLVSSHSASGRLVQPLRQDSLVLP